MPETLRANGGRMLATVAALVGVWGGGVTHLGAGVPIDLELEFVVGGLVRPLAIRHAGDGSGRLFIVEQAGRIRVYDQTTESLLPTPFLDITALVDDGGNEQGLLGLDFHPDFETNGFFYVNYTRDPGPGLDRTVVARYQVSAADPNVADPASASTLLEVAQDFSNHNGGDIHFGPDGMLYIALGDGGSGFDPNDRAQSRDQLLGKMLRIDVDGSPPSAPNDLCGLVTNYGIPLNNPFAGGSGDCDEIWAEGLRNPWRFSFDRATGDMFIGDVGQNAQEEVSFQPATSPGGENYGWSCMEGNLVQNFNPCLPVPLTAPIFTYNHDLGFSLTGGYRYRGPISPLVGFYFVADYGSGRIWAGEETSPGTWSFSQWMNTNLSIASFGEDEAGHLYLADFGTGIYRFSLPAGVGASRVPDGSDGPPLTVDRASGDQITLSWGASCSTDDTDYEVYEGAVAGDFSAHKRKLCSTGGATATTILPGSGSRYYLIVPRDGTNEGSYGKRSNGQERPAAETTCMPQVVDECPRP